ncbi:regakine-1-like [Ursus americanus]|uniref:Regakine-1-like n=2 Tax=Ursus TaxID=9639 RepID=A0A384CGP5_URSMA|nr:regakine-1-like [Ursus maritimus]XP_026373367.1 regakine-1-like [Ursus arctos]XP_045629251.1 regakine-1-like [Ursus americanus]
MKVILALLVFLLILVALHSEANEESVKLNPVVCCFAYTTRKVPLRFVKGYDRTSDQCSTPGVIFLTRHNRQICANPDVPWVQEYIRHLDNMSN